MPCRATYCKGSRGSISETSSSDGQCRQSSHNSNLTHPLGPSSHTDGWLGTRKGASNPVAKTSLSIWDIVGSIGVAVRKGRVRLSVRSYFGESRVGWIRTFGVIWKEWVREMKRRREANREQLTRREVTEELSCRTSVCPVHGKK